MLLALLSLVLGGAACNEGVEGPATSDTGATDDSGSEAGDLPVEPPDHGGDDTALDGDGTHDGADPGDDGGGSDVDTGAESGGEPGDGEDSGGDLALGCVVPSTLPADPLAMTSQLWVRGDDDGGFRVHLLDLDIDPASGVIYGVGLGGVMAFTEVDGVFDLVGSYRIGSNDYEHVQVIAPGVVVAVARNKWILVLDTSDPAAMVPHKTIPTPDVAGLDSIGEHTYAVTLTGELLVVRTANPKSASVIRTVPGLGTGWDFILSEDGTRGYVADAELGIVPVDLTIGDDPVLGAPAPTSGAALRLARAGNYLYVAEGTLGVEVFSLADPAAPQPVGLYPIGGTAVSVTVGAGRLWATNQTSVVVMDATDPLALSPIATQGVEEWAMDAVTLGDDVAIVADWGFIERYEVDPDAVAPDADLSTDTVFFTGGNAVMTLTLTNRGGAPLHVLGTDVGDPRVTLAIDELVIAPAAAAVVTVTFIDTGSPIETTACIATDDADAPLLELSITATSEGSTIDVGQAAADFTLPGLDGETYTLSEQLGHPVLLVYFATW